MNLVNLYYLQMCGVGIEEGSWLPNRMWVTHNITKFRPYYRAVRTWGASWEYDEEWRWDSYHSKYPGFETYWDEEKVRLECVVK